MADADPLANAKGATYPPGVNQPAVNAVALNLVSQQVRIIHRMMHHERRTKACAERDLRLKSQSDLGPCNFGGITRNEMIERLRCGQLRNRRHHPLRIARE